MSLFFLPVVSNAQPQSTSAILKTAFSALSLEQDQLIIDFLETNAFELPVVEELELRTETDEMDLDRQEYLVRVRMNTKKERAKQDLVHQKNIQVAKADKTRALLNALKSRYRTLVKHHYLQQNISLKEQQLVVVQDKIQYLQQLAQVTTDIDIDKLLNAEEKEQDIRYALLALDAEKDEGQWILQQLLNTNLPVIIDDSDFIRIETIRRLSAEAMDSLSVHPDIAYREARLQQSMAEYDLELTEDSKILDFVQLKYSGRDNLNAFREFSFGAGIQIPLKKANQIQWNELMLDRINDENQLNTTQEKLVKDTQKAHQQLLALLEQYNFVEDLIQQHEQRYTSERLATIAQQNPLSVLNLEATRIGRLRLQNRLGEDIHLAFLEWIENSGRLLDTPNINWLSDTLEPLEKK